MKKYLVLLVTSILIVLYPVSETQAKSVYAITTYKTPVSTTYVWKHTFKEKVLKKSVTTKNIYLTEYSKSTRIPVSITLLKGEKTIQIKPKKALKAGQKYTIIMKNIKSVKGKTLTTKPIKKVFTTKKIVNKTSEGKPKLTAVLSTTVKTTGRTVTGAITEKNGKIAISYDFRNSKDEELVESSSFVTAKNYTLTLTKVPPIVSVMLSESYTEKLTKGENDLLLAEKMKAYKASIGLIRIVGDFTVEGTLTDDKGQVTPITLTFITKK